MSYISRFLQRNTIYFLIMFLLLPPLGAFGMPTSDSGSRGVAEENAGETMASETACGSDATVTDTIQIECTVNHVDTFSGNGKGYGYVTATNNLTGESLTISDVLFNKSNNVVSYDLSRAEFPVEFFNAPLSEDGEEDAVEDPATTYELWICGRYPQTTGCSMIDAAALACSVTMSAPGPSGGGGTSTAREESKGLSVSYSAEKPDVDYKLSAFWSSEQDKKDEQEKESDFSEALGNNPESNIDIRTASSLSAAAGGASFSTSNVKATNAFINGDIYTAADDMLKEPLETTAKGGAKITFTSATPLRGAAMAAAWTESTSVFSYKLSAGTAKSIPILRKLLDELPLKGILKKAAGAAGKIVDFTGNFMLVTQLDQSIQLHNKPVHTVRTLTEIEATSDKDYNLVVNYRSSKQPTAKTNKAIRIHDPSGVEYDDADYKNEKCAIIHAVTSEAKSKGFASGVFGGASLAESWWYIISYAVDDNDNVQMEIKSTFMGGTDEGKGTPGGEWRTLEKDVNEKVVPWLEKKLREKKYPTGQEIRAEFEKVVPEFFKRKERDVELGKD